MSQYPIRKRASATVDAHRAGHSSNHHPEDQPYVTGQRKKYPNPLDLADSLDYPGERTRLPSSAVRYIDRQGNTVIRQGNRQLILHDEPPPRQSRRPHWLLISGISMLVLLLLWVGLSWLSSWWNQRTLDATYEFPRISQADAVIYPGDSAAHPSHYLFLNLQGTVLIIELPHGDSLLAKSYKGPTIFATDAANVPITGEFRVVNGKIEMLVHIQDHIILYINNGKQFIPQ